MAIKQIHAFTVAFLDLRSYWFGLHRANPSPEVVNEKSPEIRPKV